MIRYESRDGVAIITLDRPEKRNALDNAMCVGLRAAWERFSAEDEARVAVLTAVGPVFSAGADLNDMPAETFPFAIPEIGIAIDKPVIAATSGAVIGAGLAIVAGCDLCVAAEDTRFVYPEAKVGAAVGYIAGIVARLPHKVAMELMFTGEPLPARRAYEAGFVNRLVPAGEQLAEALRMAQGIAANAPLVIGMLKRMVRETLPRSPAERALAARREMDRVAQSEDRAEGARAFREKRPPKFRGR